MVNYHFNQNIRTNGVKVTKDYNTGYERWWDRIVPVDTHRLVVGGFVNQGNGVAWMHEEISHGRKPWTDRQWDK